MRLAPAHIDEAKEVSKLFRKAIAPEGLMTAAAGPFFLPTLQQAQAMVALALGYRDWLDLSQEMKRAHEPSYLDDMDPRFRRRVSVAMATAMAARFHLIDVSCLAAIDKSSLGYSPKFRAARLTEKSVLGMRVFSEDPSGVEGITIATLGMGGIADTIGQGFLLNEVRQLEMPDHLSQGISFYPLMESFQLIVAAFPRAFANMVPPALVKLGLLTNALILTQEDQDLADHLIQCVHMNLAPLAQPTETPATVQEWHLAFRTAMPGYSPSANSAMSSTKWRDHWERARNAKEIKVSITLGRYGTEHGWSEGL
jgi:hypothetical protein